MIIVLLLINVLLIFVILDFMVKLSILSKKFDELSSICSDLIIKKSNIDVEVNNIKVLDPNLLLKFFSVLIVCVLLYKGCCLVSDTSVYKFTKLVDSKVSHILDYFLTPKVVTKFTDISGYEITLTKIGEKCEILVLNPTTLKMENLSDFLNTQCLNETILSVSTNILDLDVYEKSLTFFSCI